MQHSRDRWPTPWWLVDHDERIIIVAANGASVTEVQPGQISGHIATREERRALAQRMVDAVNNPIPDDCPTPFVCGLKTEPARSPDAPWLRYGASPTCGEIEDGA